MIPDHDAKTGQAMPIKCRIKMIGDEIALFLPGVNAGIPGLDRIRLVLHANAPYWDTFFLQSFNKTHVMFRPGAGILLEKFSP